MDFNSQGIILVVEYVFQTPPWYHRHRSFTGEDSLANRVFTLLLHHLPPLPFISPNSPLLSLPLRHNHRFSSPLSLISFIIVIGIPCHHRNCSHLPSCPTIIYPPPPFACQMPSKRAKYSQKKKHFSCAIVKFA